jgi:soluble P-type ATPase
MIEVQIPGFGDLTIKHLVCDYNGTLACDGTMLPGVGSLLEELSRLVEIHVLTADTFGLAREQLQGLSCTLRILPESSQDAGKQDYVKLLGSETTICVGNGRNDRLMLEEAIVGIALIQEEGASAATLESADVVCRSIGDALTLLLNPKRLTATLRS